MGKETMRKQEVCHNCHGVMMLHPNEKKKFTVNGKEIEVSGVDIFRCGTCGEEMISAADTKKIMEILIPKSETMLNLEEAANYLRVSNQTVYNMIKSKRIKAVKAGREWRFRKADIENYLNANTN